MIYQQFLRYRPWRTEIGNFGSYFALSLLLKTQNIWILKKWKKLMEISSFYTCVPKITIIWCTVPVMRSEMDRIFCDFGPLFALLPPPPPDNPEKENFEKTKKMRGGFMILHMCTINDYHMMYGSWDKERDRQNFLSFCAIFCPFTPLTARKIKILKNWKKAPGDIIIFHMSTKSYDHMMYGSWDMVRKRRTDRQRDRQKDRWTDGRTEKVTYIGGCPT